MTDLTQALRDLPEHDPPPGGWTRLQAQLDPPRRRAGPAVGLALAASLALAFALTLLRPEPATVPAAPDAELASLVRQSQALEQNLSQLKPQVAVWSSRLAADSAALQNDLALVDLQLNYAEEPDGARRLWQNRVQLMAQLVQTHRQAALDSTQPEQYL